MRGRRIHPLEKCVFEATLACNLKCAHCGSRAGKARPDELSLAEASAVFRDLSTLGCSKLVLMGGEVMLRADWVKLVAAGAGLGMKVGLLSNGLLVNERSARTAKSAGLHALGLSLDGLGEVHDEIRGRPGVFDGVIAACEAATSADLPFSFVTQINRSNLHQLEEIHEFIEQTPAFAWQVQIGETVGNMVDHPELHLRRSQIPEFTKRLAGVISSTNLHIVVGDSVGYFGPEEEILRLNQGIPSFGGCQAGKTVVGLESNGNVKGCLSIAPGYSDGGDRYVEGNVRDRSIIDIWNSEEAFAYNRSWDPAQLGGHCKDCEHAIQCRGGCRSHMVAAGQGEWNPLCVYRIVEEKSAPPPMAASLAKVAMAAALVVGAVGCEGKSSEDRLDGGGDGDVDSDSDMDSDSDANTDTETGSDPDAGIDTDTWPEDGGVTLYMFCMDVDKGRTGVPVAHKCGGATCARSLIEARKTLASEKPTWKNTES